MKNLFLATIPFAILACQPPPPEEDRYLIAYNVLVDDQNDNYDVFVIDPDSSTGKNITRHPDVAWTYLAYDQHIYMVSDRSSNCERCYHLWKMNSKGEAEQVSDIRIRDSWMGIRKDGSELIVNPHPSVDSVFYIISEAGELLKKVDTGLPFASDPAFSPDGELIAFRGALAKSKREEGFDEAIYVIGEDGSGLTKLSSYPESDTTAAWYAYKAGTPRWHPSGEFISFQSYRDGGYSLYAVTPDGSKQWKLLDEDLDFEEGWHDWSPDGKWLAIEVFDHDQTQFNILLMDWETKDWKLVTDTSYQYQQAPVFVKAAK